MTCPTCSRTARDFVNSSGLLTRCDDVWHSTTCFVCKGNGEAMGCPRCLAVALPRHWLAESTAIARPDDFATQAAPDSPKPPPTHHGVAEAVLGHPYTTPIPTAHDGSTGWVYCNTCEAPQPVSGHECGKDPRLSYAWGLEDALFREQARLEFAESLLCAMAFDHGRECIRAEQRLDLLPCDAVLGRACVFCDAARGGGR